MSGCISIARSLYSESPTDARQRIQRTRPKPGLSAEAWATPRLDISQESAPASLLLLAECVFPSGHVNAALRSSIPEPEGRHYVLAVRVSAW